jgi:glycerol-3-phosphate O-acyltransferase 1/2
VIVEAFIDGLIDDAILVPVSVNYEKLVDGNFVNEQMGTPKQKETFGMAMASIWKVLKKKFGLMRIDFNEPFSLGELVRSFQERKASVPRPIPSARKLLPGTSVTSMYGIEVIDKHRVLVDNIARHVVYDCSYATSVMSTNAVAYLLLNKYRNGTTLKELSKALTELRKQIGDERDFAFEGDYESVMNAAKRGIDLLGEELVRTKYQNGDVFVEPVLSTRSVIETAYYSNTFTPYFALDAVVVTSIATVNEGAPMALVDITDTAMLFCDILRYEFIFHKPCQDFSEHIEKSVTRLCKANVLTRINDDNVSLNFVAARTLLSTLAPFSIAYLSVTECLKTLVEATQMVERDFMKQCLGHIEKQIASGEITFAESFSTDSVKNCMKVLEKWTVIEVDAHSGVRVSLN